MMTSEVDNLSLLRTKLHRPRVTGDLVLRPRLQKRLDRQCDRPLTLIVAPTGFGKTTLAASWLERCDHPNAWLTLDSGDDDLIRFVGSFSAAIRTMFPDSMLNTLALLRAAGRQPPLDALTHSLLNELDQLEPPFVLVLDDCHNIQQVEVYHLLGELLRHPPRALHLMLLSRSDPPLPLTALRARGLATEIRTHELRFTAEETAAFLQRLGVPADEATVRSLMARLEGWPAGIRLAVLSSRQRGSHDLLSSPKVGSLPYLMDYLLTEVLEGQPPAIQDYLLRTAVLERFCAPLCEAVCSCPDEKTSSSQAESPPEVQGCEMSGQTFLEWLEVGDLFVVPLDDRREWYRYHHFFQQLLRKQLQRRCRPDEIAAIHARASAWFAQEGLIGEAIEHALAAGDELAAAQLVEENARALLDEDRWPLLEKRLFELSDELIQQRPHLLLAKAWIAYFHAVPAAIPPLLETLEALLDTVEDEDAQSLQGEVDFFWGHHWYWQGQFDRSLERLERALERIPKSYRVARSIALVFWSLAAQASGQKREVIRRLQRMRYSRRSLAPPFRLRVLGTPVLVHMLSGELPQAAQAVLEYQDFADQQGNLYGQSWALYVQAHCHYGWGDLEQAARYFALAVEKRYALYTRAAVDSLSGLALSYHLLGREAEAAAALDLLLDFARERTDLVAMVVARSCQARLALLRGDLAAASGWLRTAELPAEPVVMFLWLEIPHITQCRVLVAQGTAASLREAEEKLARYQQASEAQHNTRQLLDILPLQALVYHKQGDADRALDTLGKAVRLAEPGGWVRPFVEPGPVMAALLRQVRRRGVAPDFVDRLLAAFPAEVRARLGSATPILEPLTRREKEVLALLAQRLSNKEIAAQLGISAGTVRQHTHTIYQKLDVKGRRQAVDKALALGILFPARESSGRLFLTA